MTDLNKYQKLSEIEHILSRSGMYLGSTSNTTSSFFLPYEGKMKEKQITYNPAICKMFDEVISNSVDEHTRSGNVSKIEVNLSPITGEIEISDDGGIPVKKHPEYDQWIPSMIFGELRTGSNFSDEDRFSAGLNGLGAKLTSVFSTSFRVETCDGKKKFVQLFENNLQDKHKPVINTSNKPGTKITFTPDYDRLKCSLDDDNIKRMEKRVYDIAGCNPKIKVYLNGDLIKVNKFQDYVSMYVEESVEDFNDHWHIAIAANKDDTFRHVSFVNGVDTFNGGSHVDYIVMQIALKLRDYIKKKHKIDVKPNNIKQQMFLFINCKINAPMFTSQTKEYMSSDVKDFGTSFEVTEKFLARIIKSDVVQKILDWAEAQERQKELAELRKMNKQTQKVNYLKKIVKFDDATSKVRSDCVLALTEGDCIEENEYVLVYTSDSIENKKIKDLNIGDYVLTHRNRLKPIVSKTQKVSYGKSIKTCNEKIKCSLDHKWLVYNKETDSYVFLKTENLIPGTHCLVENFLFNVKYIETITSIQKGSFFQNGVLYDFKINFGDDEMLSTKDHKYMVFNSNTLEFKKVCAKHLDKEVHMMVLM